MDSNFLSRYNETLINYENLIRDDLVNSSMHQKAMTDYMLKCMPYIVRYTTEDKTSEYDETFGTRISKGTQKSKIYMEYLKDVEGLSKEPVVNPIKAKIPKHKKSAAVDNERLSCSACKSSDVFVDYTAGDIVCTACGLSDIHIADSNISYKDEQEHEVTFTYSYKRENHFNEWITQFQAQETTTIPDTVMDDLKAEFKKQKITSLTDITHAKVKGALKKLRHNKYYEHVPFITNILNGSKPPSMSPKLEDTLRKMFDEIQLPFDKHCPKERKNFLSYSYVIYKFCELLEEDDYLPYFPLLKSKEKLHQQDVIWKKICEELKWEFIKTA